MSDGQLDLFGDRVGAHHAEWRGAPETEVTAAVRVLPFSGAQRCRYVLVLVPTGSRGLTDHEACELGVGSSYHVAGTRRKELVDEDGQQLVLDSGRRRMSPFGRPCAVWVASDRLLELHDTHHDALVEKANRRPRGR